MKQERISELKDKEEKLTQSEQKKKKNTLRDLWESIKQTNIHIVGAPEGEERQKFYFKK